MKIIFSNKKTGHTICGKVIEYLSKKRKITLEQKGAFYALDQGMLHPNNALDYFFIEVFDKKMKKINLLLQFWLGGRSGNIDCDGNIQFCLGDSIEFFNDGTITCSNKKGDIIWTIKEDTYVFKVGSGGSIL